jgi:hypothetical protein
MHGDTLQWHITLQGPPGADSARRLALLSIGEIGRRADLSAFPQLQQALTSALTSQSEEIKSAASLALGGVCIGNLDTYLPFIVQQIKEQVSHMSLVAPCPSHLHMCSHLCAPFHSSAGKSVAPCLFSVAVLARAGPESKGPVLTPEGTE